MGTFGETVDSRLACRLEGGSDYASGGLFGDIFSIVGKELRGFELRRDV